MHAKLCQMTVNLPRQNRNDMLCFWKFGFFLGYSALFGSQAQYRDRAMKQSSKGTVELCVWSRREVMV